MKIKEIISSIESLAPLQLQESYDNSGFLIGDPEATFSKALVSLDITGEVIDEAIKKSCNLIISHHPLIFGKLSKISANTETGKCMIKAIKNDIAIYAVHTNIDNVANGVNAMLCKKLGIQNCKILKPKKNILKKLVTYCPTDKAEIVRTALFNAGAGHIGNYDCCSYNTAGSGSFRALENANPYVGKLNKLHFENETRIETIYPSYIEKELLKVLFSAHPYEEVAYDIYPLENEFSKAGEGMIGELPRATDCDTFFQKIKLTLGTGVIRHSEITKKNIKRIAVCGGAGGFLINDALASGADIFLTADLKYHQFFEAEKRMIIADIGHYESEQFTKEILVDFLNEKFPTFAFLISKVRTNSVKYFY
jgi:dinuclear metal center YbgI/SA1388 family protein